MPPEFYGTRRPAVTDATAARSAGAGSTAGGSTAAGCPSGRTSSAERPGAPTARAATGSRRRTSTGTRARARRPPPPSPGRRGRPGASGRAPSRSSVERSPAQTWGIRPPRSACTSCSARADRAARIGRPRDGVLGDGTALGLVGVQQRRPRPAPQHPARASSRGRAVVQREVEARPAPRGHPVGGVAGQEDRAAAERSASCAADGEGARALDPHAEGRARPRRRRTAPRPGARRARSAPSLRSPNSQRSDRPAGMNDAGASGRVME